MIEKSMPKPEAAGGIGRKPELLAPAGTLEVFETAVAAGADAVYIGAPFFNARELARHFTMAEVAAMIDHGHRHRVKVFLAMNSLVKEDELPQAVESLARLEPLEPDGLIIQDLGLFYLLKKYFPRFRLHASTLMAAHNLPAVAKLAELGFRRVVLPRELTLAEIAAIRAETEVELEVFVHGAMCFSYSGLCLFSSFQGGRSGLRGRCVQPCRRRYTWQGKGRKPGASGYFFSMNDLQGLELLADLRRAGVDSLKIEGRMRNAAYVGNVVKAYRLVLDQPGDPAATREALTLLARAMGRQPSRGYFPGPRPQDVLAPRYSGNVGKFLGKIRSVRGKEATLVLQAEVSQGDRLRLHQEESGERQAFTLKEFRVGKRQMEKARAGDTVHLTLPGAVRVGDTLFQVDLAGRRSSRTSIRPEKFAGRGGGDKVAGRVRRLLANLFEGGKDEIPGRRAKPAGRSGGRRPSALPLWVMSEEPAMLRQSFPVTIDRFVLLLSPESLVHFGRSKLPPQTVRRLVWALPPLIDQERLADYRRLIDTLIDQGFRDWQVAHPGQLGFFAGRDCRLYGDYRLNLLNSLAARFWREQGLSGGQVAIETDRANLANLLGHPGLAATGMTVYGYPALFTSRFTGPPLQYNQPFTSPRGENFLLRQAWGYTLALPGEPFSLLHRLPELADLGLDYGVVDLCGLRLNSRALAEIFRPRTGESKRPVNEFNFGHTLS
jgi:putative protease